MKKTEMTPEDSRNIAADMNKMPFINLPFSSKSQIRNRCNIDITTFKQYQEARDTAVKENLRSKK